MSEFDALCANDSELAKLRSSIREFLAADRHEFGWQPAVDSWLANWDEGFSARLGDAGFVGLTIPTEYGGRAQQTGHQLWLATMRARSWIDEFGTTGFYARRLGRLALAADNPWDVLIAP